jgi:hypothetical protein
VTPIDLLKLTGGPGSIQLLLVLTAVGVLLHYRRPRYRTIARLILGSTLSAYWILATPVTALAIEGWLPQTTGAVPHNGGFDTVVVLDGDNRRGRLQTSLAVWRTLAPGRLVVSGQDWLRDELIAAGVPEERVKRESATANTREQVTWLRAFAAEPSSGRMAVIASRLQAPRVAALIRRADIRTTIVAAPIDAEPPSAGLWTLVPSYAALRLSRDALYECAALKYYEMRGWIDPPAARADGQVSRTRGSRPHAWLPRA